MKLPPQVFVSPTKPEPHLIDPVRSELFWKPRGGMWTSTHDEEGGDWVRWLTGEGYSLDDPKWGGKLWLLQPTDANVYVIATPEDLRDLSERYPITDPSMKEITEKLVTYSVTPDWVSVAADYDAVHVPNPWAHRFGFSMDDEDGGLAYAASMFFYVMDAESTCWFNWCFEGEPELIELMKGGASGQAVA